MDEVYRQGVPLVVTRRGKPIVRVVPFRGEKKAKDLLGAIVHEADDIFSTGEKWEADK
jgi:antitoxin (DNA-binding transcriptional repressor) of toxin-antitoxin stability system